MQSRENRILSITPILRKKMLRMLDGRPDWSYREMINKKCITEEISPLKHKQQTIPKHGQQIIQNPRHGQQNKPNHGQQIIQGHGKSYIQYYIYETTIEKIDFIEKNLDEFVLLCSACFKQLKKSDCESIGTLFPTPNARKLYQLLNYLIKNGFPGPDKFNNPINFWSGDVAMKKAHENQNEISANEIPAIAILFEVCNAIKEVQGHDDFIHLIESCIMRLFASYAKGIASVYISSDKNSESAGFTTQNFFWTDELVVLRELKRRRIVRDININLYNHEKKKWDAPVSLSSSESQYIPIRTRSIHPLDDPEAADRFKKPDMTEADKIAWRESLPRPQISFGRIQEIARTWRQKAEYKQNSDKYLSTLKEKCEELIKIYKQDIEREWQHFNTAAYYINTYYINIGVNTAHLQYKKPTTTERAIQEFKNDKYYIQTKAKLDVLEFIKKTDSIHDAKTIFEKNKEIFALERDKYKTRILRGIALIISCGLSYGLSDAKNLSHYFTRTRSSIELENILNPAAASLNMIRSVKQ